MIKTAAILLLTSTILFSQSILVEGTIRDSITGDFLSFANISVNNNSGTSSNPMGEFQLSVSKGVHTFVISYVGYNTRVVEKYIDNENNRLDIKLVSKSILLQEVPVYSLGTSDEQKLDHAAYKSKHLKEIPRTLPDILRSIQSLPGIVTNNEYSAQYNVRGGNFDENLILINGAKIYEPYHLKVANQASVGIFNNSLIKSVNLITGGFSAEYGDKLSSVLNINYKEGNKVKHKGALTLSLTNMDLYFEGPLSKKFTYIIGVRKSYLKYVLDIINTIETVDLDFYDIQGVLNFTFSKSNKLTLKVIHAGDDFLYSPTTNVVNLPKYPSTLNGQSVFVNENYVDYEDGNTDYFTNLIDLKNTLLISTIGKLETSISYYNQIEREFLFENDTYDYQAVGADNYFYKSERNYNYNYDLKINTIESASNLLLKITPFYEIKSGINYTKLQYNQKTILEDIYIIEENIAEHPDTIFSTRDVFSGESVDEKESNSFKLAGYFENTVQINNHFIFRAGVRSDYFKMNEEITFSPRLSAFFNTPAGLTIRAAWGYFFQTPDYKQLISNIQSDTNTKSQKAEHFIFGLEKKIPLSIVNSENLLIKFEVYYKKYHSLISSTRSSDGKISYSGQNDSEGYAAGIDFHLSLNLKYYFGWLSYGLLFAKENLLADNSEEFPRYTDQRHTLSFINDFDFGKGWNVNISFTYGSGFAYTPQTALFNSDINRYQWIGGKNNSAYLPQYRRIDFRISKKFSIGRMQLITFVDVNNITDFKNIYGYKYRFNKQGIPFREEVKLWPILPTFGFTVKF